MIAESIIAAAAELGRLTHPMVVRLQGTNSEAGLKLVGIHPLYFSFHEGITKVEQVD
jgi:succinyl-CoA synthetase beta subunit